MQNYNNLVCKTLLMFFWGIAFQVSANAQCAISVFAQVNAALAPATCSYTPTVTQLLAAIHCPGGSLVVQAYIGGTWVTNPTFTYTHVNQTYQFRVYDQISGNFAVGNITIQDKIAPVITCGSPVTINCEQTCAALPAPTVSDCDPNVQVTYTETSTIQPCANPNLRVINRVYKATDAGGNTATCNWTYNIRRQPTSVIVFPAHLTLSVNSSDCSPWCENLAGAPAPSPTSSAAQFAPGVPTINSVPLVPVQNPAAGCNGVCIPNCGYTVSYNDVVTTLCGTNRRISRTWTATSACSGTVSFVQNITIYTDGNTTCGQACTPPTGLSHQFPTPSTVKFLWTAPASCIVRYQVQYRFKIGGLWGVWSATTTSVNNLTVTKPAGAVQGQYFITTVCNGVSSTATPTYNFLINGLQNPDDRTNEEDADALPVFIAEKMRPGIWPNPTTGVVQLDLGQPLTEPGLLSVLTLDGRLIATQPLPTGTVQASLSLSNQPDGVYLLRVQIANQVSTERVQLLHN